MTQIDIAGGPIVLAKSQIDALIPAADALAGAGLSVLEATSSDEVLSYLESRSDIRVVIADLALAGCFDGLELARFVKQRWPYVGMIVVRPPSTTAHGQAQTRAALWGQHTLPALVDEIRKKMGAGCSTE
jgi:CheY-like chemotaxis protein